MTSGRRATPWPATTSPTRTHPPPRPGCSAGSTRRRPSSCALWRPGPGSRSAVRPLWPAHLVARAARRGHARSACDRPWRSLSRTHLLSVTARLTYWVRSSHEIDKLVPILAPVGPLCRSRAYRRTTSSISPMRPVPGRETDRVGLTTPPITNALRMYSATIDIASGNICRLNRIPSTSYYYL